MRAFVYAVDNPLQKLRLECGKPIRIGRDRELCQILVTHPGISRSHCTLIFDGESVTVTDLQSRNGTYVNEVRITEHRFQSNSRFRTWTVEFQIEFVEGADSALESPTTALS